MGNLFKQSFEEIWHSPAYEEFRDKALRLPKSDPYFAPIGCYKCCDNLMHNEEVHRRIQALRPDEIENLKRDVSLRTGGEG